MPLTHSVSGDTRRKWTWSKGGGRGGKLDSLGTMGGGNRSETAGMGACIHRVRDVLFRMGANLVGGNRAAHLCGRVDPLMIVSQVLMGVGYVSASLCEANDKRPFPPGGRVNTHTLLCSSRSCSANNDDCLPFVGTYSTSSCTLAPSEQ
jgi:hypothetical protein